MLEDERLEDRKEDNSPLLYDLFGWDKGRSAGYEALTLKHHNGLRDNETGHRIIPQQGADVEQITLTFGYSSWPRKNLYGALRGLADLQSSLLCPLRAWAAGRSRWSQGLALPSSSFTRPKRRCLAGLLVDPFGGRAKAYERLHNQEHLCKRRRVV